MPSFLNKVFGYKKHDDKESPRPPCDVADNSLLDGKYEAIPPLVSAPNSVLVETQTPKHSDRDVLGFSLFKSKARGLSLKSSRKDPAAIPHLTLHLPGPKDRSDSRALGIVFEADPDAQILLDHAVIAAKRLNPLETLILIRACAQAITERGLETLGIMHPHWFSASPDIQPKLISLFIRSLNPTHQSRTTTLPPTPTSSPLSALENELRYTRLPHDVAAVFRWGLRHLSLENSQFGKDADWAWYNTFFHAERKASYPHNAFSQLLLPQLPPPHAELLIAVLNLISSLAAHAETNSISGSKLSKFLGLWLLVTTRAEQSDDWIRFYARWERAGRVLEHIFLARLREESFAQRLPTRLQELVKYYPYNQGSSTTDGDLLSRPRFSTRQYDALLVRVESLLAHSTKQPKQHPIQLLLEAFQLPVENAFKNEHTSLWHTLKSTVSGESTASDAEGPQFSHIFVDETIQVLSLIPAVSDTPMSPTFLTSPVIETMSRKRSSSPVVFERSGSESNANTGTTPVSPTSPTSPVITDWAQFSLSGFGDAPTAQPLVALLAQDDDVEVTQPRLSRKSSRQRGKPRSRRRRSEDPELSDNLPSSQPDHASSTIETKLASVRVVQVDEAFIDFWSDAIVDPISANWPTFVVCGLKQIPNVNQSIRWLIIEQTYSRQQPQNSRVPSPDGPRGRSPRPSFKSDISGFRINSVLSSARKRFSVFSKSATDLELKKSGGKTPITGELGEILVEEEITHSSVAGALVAPPVAVVPTVDVADRLKANGIDTTPIAGTSLVELAPTLNEESNAVHVAAEVPSVEPNPQSGDGENEISVQSSIPEGVPAEQCAPRTLDGVTQGVNSAVDPVAKMTPLAAEVPNFPATQDTSDSTVLISVPTAENPLAAGPQTKAEPVRQDNIIEAQHQLVKSIAHPRDGDQLSAEPSGEPSNMVQVDVADVDSQRNEAVTSLSAFAAAAVPTSITQPAVPAAVADKIPEPAVNELHVTDQVSRNAPANLLAASTAEPVTQPKIDDLAPVPATDVQGQNLVEMPAQLEDAITCVVDEPEEPEEVAERVEIPTPIPERVVLVEETPGPEASDDVNGFACAARMPASENKPLEDAGAQDVATEFPSLGTEKVFVRFPVETPSLEITPAADTTTQILPIDTEHAADRVPELATEEARPLAQDIIVETTSAADISAVHESIEEASAEVQVDDALEDVDTGAPTPVAETTVLVHDTPSAESGPEASEACQVTPSAVLASEVPEDGSIPPVVVPPTELTPLVAEADLPTQPVAAEPVEFIPDKIIVDAPAEPTSITHVDGVEAHAPVPLAQVTPEGAVPPSASAEVPSITAIVEDDTAVCVTEITHGVDDAALTASEPVCVTHDVQPCVDDLESDTEPQGNGTAPDQLGGVSAPEAISLVEPEKGLEPNPAVDMADELVEDIVVMGASESEVPVAESAVPDEQVVASELRAPETDVSGPQDVDDVPAEQPATGDIVSSAQEAAVPSEVASAES